MREPSIQPRSIATARLAVIHFHDAERASASDEQPGCRRRSFDSLAPNRQFDGMSTPAPQRPTAAKADTATPSGERALRALAGLVVVGLMVACGGAPKRPSAASTTATRPAGNAAQLANAVLFRAIGLVGTPYRWGGNTPESGFDCSGLVGYVYRDAAGLVLPRTSSAISEVSAPRVKRGQLSSGDLVFFGSRGRVNHVGIYVGEGRFVHAPNSGGTVRLDELDGHYWRDAWLYGKRVLR